ncbi:MAG: NAD(P)H-hydrate epimerase [Planctomycetaceae bacterium]|nr:NAD(P)H-hydrate epimerase [Planctomycetaceae bacterium]
MTGIALTREQSRQVDRIAMEVYGFSGLVLMENAGRGVADYLERLGIDGTVVICCGRGNNGGDGFVIARHLDLRGYQTRVLLYCDPAQLAGDAAANFRILEKTDVPIHPCYENSDADGLQTHLAGASWIVDALLGTGARGEPRPPLDSVIDRLNASGIPILAVDVPSGLDCDTGEPSEHTVRAAHTCTFVTAKVGYLNPNARPYLGELHVLSIGTPTKLVTEFFERSEEPK